MKEIRQLLSYTKKLHKYFLVITLTSVFGALVNLAIPFFMKLATDWIVAIVSGKVVFSVEPLGWLIVALIVMALVSTALSDIGGVYGDLMAMQTRRQLSRRYFSHLLTLPQSYYDNEITGKIINRLSRAIGDVSGFFQFFANNLLQMLLTLMVTIGILLWYSIPLGVLFVLLIPTSLFITAKTSNKWQKYEKEKNTHFDYASGRFAEVVGQMRLVKSFGSEKRELDIFTRKLTTMVGITRKQSIWWHGMNSLRSSVFGIIFALIYGTLFYQTARGKFSVGDMVMLLTLIQQVAFPIRSLSYFVDSYQRAVANSRDFLNAMTEKPESQDEGKNLEVSKANVSFKTVDFAYTKGRRVLHDVSFHVKAGSKVALVGESGGGKSTIANLLMRLYSPSKGVIYVNDIAIDSVTRSSLRSHIATVFQDAALFSGTIRENIVYGKPNATDEEVENAARVANAYMFIQEFDSGFETEIGERGIKLSGGQKQRIAIARAVLKNAPILILDEATSALDSRAEHDVQQALERLMYGRTTIIIAHRLSTIAGVDQIITLLNGRIDEIGSPSKLAKSGGIYAQLLTLQMGAAENTKQQLAKYDIAS